MGEEKRERIEMKRTNHGNIEYHIRTNLSQNISGYEVLSYEGILRHLTGALRVDSIRISNDNYKACYSFSWNTIKTLIMALEPVDRGGDQLEIIAEKLCRNVKIVMDAFDEQKKKEDESYVFYI